MAGDVPERAAESPESTDVGRLASDAELIAATRDGDATSYGVLFERHAHAARRLAGHMLSGSVEAEDIVSEAFVRTLTEISNGGGPSEAFRPFLLAMVGRVGRDVLNGRRTPDPGADPPDGAGDAGEPVITKLGHSLLNRAFWSLPERWSAVLWHTEVEESDPADVALILGLSAHAADALSYRAREGLRLAYLQLYVESVHPECWPAARKLADHIRGALSAREADLIDRHWRKCPDCARAYSELAQVNIALRKAVAPLVMGGAAARYLGDIIEREPLSGRLVSGLRRLRARSRHFDIARRTVTAAAGVTVVGMVAAALAYVPAGNGPRTPGGAPRVAEPAPALSRSAEGRAQPSVPVAGSASRGPSRGTSTSPKPRTPVAGPSASVRPSPVSSAGHSPSPQPSPTSTSAPGPGPSRKPSPRLALQVDLLQAPHGTDAVVVLQVSDVGGGSTVGLAASINFPAGTKLIKGSQQGEGWRCSPAAKGASCSHAAIQTGGEARMTLALKVTSGAGNGEPVSATVVSGSCAASSASPQTLRS